MPVALRRPAGSSRNRWFANHVELVLDRDIIEISRIRQREMLPRLLSRLAARTAHVLNVAAAAQAVGLEKSTAENYVRLLEAVFLVHRLPAWGTTLGARVTRQPKLHLVDSGIAAWLMGLTPAKIASADPAALTGYGHLTETFAVGEILRHISWWDAPVTVGHFRDGTSSEVDLVVESDAGRVIAFEVKAGTRIHGEDLRPIAALREKLGERLGAAVIFYTGTYAYRHEDGTLVLPLDSLWT